MARTSAKAKKPKQEVNKKKSEDEKKNANKDVKESVNAAEESNDSTDKENGSTNYEIEKIVHSRLFRGKRQFLVRWKGFKEDSDTWENESAVEDCAEALDEFKKETPNWENSSEDGSDKEAVKVKGNKKSKKIEAVNNKTGVKRGRPKKSVKEESDTSTEESAKESEGETEEEDKEKIGTKRAAKGAKKAVEKKPKKETAKKPSKDSDDESVTVEKKPKKETAKKPSKNSDDESVTDGKNYEVDRILELHTRKDGSREFLIRWKGYKPSEDTWEPEAHLDCTELIEKFMEKVEKAKNIPIRELRESSASQRFIPYSKNKGQRGSVRNRGLRPCYQE